MANTVTIDGRKYLIRKFDFNAACELAEKGYDIFQTGKVPIAVTLRAIVAWIMNVDEDTAGDVVEKHLADGGTLEEISQAFNTALEESGFLKGLMNMAQNKEAEAETETPKRLKK